MKVLNTSDRLIMNSVDIYMGAANNGFSLGKIFRKCIIYKGVGWPSSGSEMCMCHTAERG